MEITKIEPPFWFTGLKSPKLMLMIYGENLKDAHVETTIPYVDIDWRATKNYVIINLMLCGEMKVGTYEISIITLQGVKTFKYEFRPNRIWNAEKSTISSQDVIYMVMPDRFAKRNGGEIREDVDIENPDAWHGGNIAGMMDSLDYLADLGVTALWHTPVFKSSAYHGYSIKDFYCIDEHFGDIYEYRRFVRRAHELGIKIIIDVVFNHCSIEHPWIKCPPMDKWINTHGEKIITNYKVTTIFDLYASVVDKYQTVEGWFTETMPDLNLNNKWLRCYLTQMTKWWIEFAEIDAIRMDTYLYSDKEAMVEWQNELLGEYSHFSVIAETWVPEAAYTAEIQKDVGKRLSEPSSLIVMDFAFQKKIEQYLDRKVVYDKESSMYYHFVYDFLYLDARNTLAFLDNHDLPRWYDRIKSKAKLKQALGILLTVPRIPQIYYGTEFLISNDGKRAGDGSYRVDTFLRVKTSRTDEIVIFLKKLLQWRKTSKAVAKGTMKHFVPHNGVYVYFRTFENEKIMVVSNGVSRPSKLECKRYQEELYGYVCGKDVISGRKVNLTVGEVIELNINEMLILNLMKFDYGK